ncbi:MAG: VCBS repeat-containing protein [Spirochaetaceae bacterium]|jgi:hypothetical protein|nr:VCBS repeat-containing protein [Spirochaetaceae bacterium]
MEETQEAAAKKPKKKKLVRKILFFLLFLFVGLPLILIGFSFIGRVGADSVIPDSFTAYLHVPNPVHLADKALSHEPLSDILGSPLFAPALPVLVQLDESGLLRHPLTRFAARGTLDGALLSDGRILAAWDAGILSPFLRFLPALAGRLTIANLYYVQAGKLSRFEYRTGKDVWYISPYHNLLVISNNQALFESVLDGTSRDGDLRGSRVKEFSSGNYDAALLISTEVLVSSLAATDPSVAETLDLLRLEGFVEAAVSISPRKLDIDLISRIDSGPGPIKDLISRDSSLSSITRFLPDTTQYSTVLSAAGLEELIALAGQISGGEIRRTLASAESSSRLLFRMDLNELLYSWSGSEFAVFGLEGRPHPVFAVQIRDEEKRREVFDRVFSSLVINENTSVVLDGTRIPQIRLPGFLDALLRHLKVTVPMPFYTPQSGYLLICESADTLLAAVNSIRKNASLTKTAAWQTLSQSSSDLNSFSLFYSLDRSVPFFLKGNSAIASLLRFYRQGLVRLSIRDSAVRVSVSVISAPGGGLELLPGYPLDLEGRAGKEVYGISIGRRGESRLLLTRGNSAISVNPQDNHIYRLEGRGNVYVVPAPDFNPQSPSDPAAWVVDSQGDVSLVSADMEVIAPFPLITGIRLSSPPAAFGRELYLAGDDRALYSVNREGERTVLPVNFDEVLLSPPSFLHQVRNDYIAAYPKSFFGDLWLFNKEGVYPSWPVSVSGIAFGSPLVFGWNNQAYVAFITQAGSLHVFTEAGAAPEGFPVELDGVFYLQPVFDGQALWVLSSSGTLYQIGMDGTALFQDIPGLRAEEGSITVMDIDRDKSPEIFLTGNGNALYGYSRNFISLDGFPLPVWGRPYIGDLNGDGRMECAGVGMDNRLYRWQFR